MKQTLSAVEVHGRIEREGREKAVHEMRHIKSLEVGQVMRQGDIYIHAVNPKHPCGKKLKSRQLAIGETQGSRHVAESPCTVFEGTTLPEWCREGTFLGPLVKSGKRFTVSHPEHAHVSLPAGCFQITHQMDAASRQRVQD